MEYADSVAAVLPNNPRRVARHLVLDGLSIASRARSSATALRLPRVQHVFLHHVFRDEETGFARLIGDIGRDNELVGYHDSIERIWAGNFERPAVAWSFDDGLKSCLTAGRMLRDAGVSACFFVVTSMVGVRDDTAVARFCRERLAMPPTELLDWADVESLRAMGHEIGSHGATHRRLADLSAGEVDDELGGSYETLRKRLGEVRHFAWPYGHFTDGPPDLVPRALAAGYLSAAANERGAHAEAVPKDRLCVRRDHVLANWPPRHVRWFMLRNARRAHP